MMIFIQKKILVYLSRSFTKHQQIFTPHYKTKYFGSTNHLDQYQKSLKTIKEE